MKRGNEGLSLLLAAAADFGVDAANDHPSLPDKVPSFSLVDWYSEHRASAVFMPDL